MLDLELSLEHAWRRIIPQLQKDPRERLARLARRQSATLHHPPRAFCLAVRASGTRINLGSACISPEHATDPDDAEHPGRVLSHEVVLDARLLRQICRPVDLRDGWYN